MDVKTEHMARAMAELPGLNDFGIGNFGGVRDDELLAKNRRALLQRTSDVAATVGWLRTHVLPTRTINRRRTSYGIKHIAEKDIGYITNGTLILAAIIAGYPYALVPHSPNVKFGMSERSLRSAGKG